MGKSSSRPHSCESTDRSSGGWLSNDGMSNPWQSRAMAVAAVWPCGVEQPSAPGEERGSLKWLHFPVIHPSSHWPCAQPSWPLQTRNLPVVALVTCVAIASASYRDDQNHDDIFGIDKIPIL